MICVECKKEIADDSKFCTECGAKQPLDKKVEAVEEVKTEPKTQPKTEPKVEIVYVEDKKTEQLLSDNVIIPLTFGVFIVSVLLIIVLGIF